MAGGFHAGDHAFDHRRLRRELAEGLAHRRHRAGADRIGEAARDAEQEPHLHGQPDLRLVVLEGVA